MDCPVVKDLLTLAEADELWWQIRIAGRHGERPEKEKRYPIVSDADARGSRFQSWVIAELPFDWLFFDWQMEENEPSERKLARARAYAQAEAPFPPGFATYSGRGKPIAFVQDGNHRGLAASMRGDTSYLVMMPEEDYLRLTAKRGCSG